MLFNSYNFLLIFAPIVYTGYWLLPRQPIRLLWLTGAGYVFYGYFDVWFVPLLLTITVINFVAGQGITRGRHPRLWLGFGLAVSLGILSVFKFYDIGVAALNDLLDENDPLLPLLSVALPLGISFYTFQSLTYTLDLYYRRTEPARSFLHFAAFTGFFPTLLSGPILRWTNFSESLTAFPKRLEGNQAVEGFKFLVIGLAKKVLIADTIASGMVVPLMRQYESNGFALTWLAVIAYTVQLYMDFSAYSDMAVGLGHWLGLAVPRNFAMPYQAVNIADFWNRWHITLSTWFRDYLFLPLSRALLRRTHRHQPDLIRAISYLATMGLIGLWHGAYDTYLFWGLYHGVLLAIYHQTRHLNMLRWVWVNRVITLIAVMFGWAIFASLNLHHAFVMWQSMVGLNGLDSVSRILSVNPEFPLLLTLLAFAGLLILPDTWSFKMPRNAYAALLLGVLAALAFGMLSRANPFLYFDF